MSYPVGPAGFAEVSFELPAHPARPGAVRARRLALLASRRGGGSSAPSKRSCRGRRRGWWRRGRRAQVSAVATMLGLMLIVTMLASFLATQLPAQMRINDTNHILQVEDQVTRLQTALRGAAAVNAIGATLSQPVSLGSVGDPPFAPTDGATIGPETAGAQIIDSYEVTGESAYAPPSVGAAGGTTGSDTCPTKTSTALSCTGSSRVIWNFTSAAPTAISITTSGGPYYINTSASNSTIAIAASSASPLNLLVSGSNDTITLNVTGTSTVVHLVIVGSYDTVAFAVSTWTSATVTIYVVGNYDTMSSNSLTATSSKLVATFFGSSEAVHLTSSGTITATTSYFNVYLNGFAPSSPSSTCPVDNLAYTTDAVSAVTHSGGTFNLTYNDTTVTSGSTPSGWTGTFGTPSISCPFYSVVTLPQRSSGAVGASFLVTLHNTYMSPAVVAFDQGAVVASQRNGIPLMIVPPPVSYNATTQNLTLWVPEFLGAVGTEEGAGTAELSVRLVSLENINLPSSGFSLTGPTSVVVTTPFAEAWYSYLNATSSLTGHVACAPKTSTVCTGPFSLNGALGTVYVNVTALALSIQVATFSLGVS